MNHHVRIIWQTHSWSGAHLKGYGWEQRDWRVVVHGVDGVMTQYLLIPKRKPLDPRQFEK